uniref:Uncharacterized protein n=1 Tax=Arundo donax TaxID=35708 RepID=A0A0A8XPG4_ARUDO
MCGVADWGQDCQKEAEESCCNDDYNSVQAMNTSIN